VPPVSDPNTPTRSDRKKKMNVLNAANRIIFEKKNEFLEGSVELDAKFAKGFLRSRGILFSLKDGALFRKTSGAEIEWEIHEVIRLMNGFGCGMIVQQSTMRNRIWALSGHGGITLQRLRCELRIFYTTR
jgi:hypothetical protein